MKALCDRELSELESPLWFVTFVASESIGSFDGAILTRERWNRLTAKFWGIRRCQRKIIIRIRSLSNDRSGSQFTVGGGERIKLKLAIIRKTRRRSGRYPTTNFQTIQFSTVKLASKGDSGCPSFELPSYTSALLSNSLIKKVTSPFMANAMHQDDPRTR